MSLNEDNLVDYIEGAWDEDNADAPGEVTKDQLLLNHCNKCLVRRIRSDPLWMGGVKQTTEIWECRLSHPTKEDGINELIRILMDFPGDVQPASHVTDDFSGTLAKWTTSNNPTIVDGWCHFPGVVDNNKIKQTGISGFDETNWTHFKWKFKVSNLTNSMYFESYAYSGGAYKNQIFVNVSAGKIYVNYGICTMDALVIGEEHVLDLVVDWAGKTVTPYLDGVAIKTATAFINPYSTPYEYFWDDDPTGPGGWDMDWVHVGCAPYINLNRVPISVHDPQYLGIDGAGNHVHSLMFVATRWE